MLDHLDRSWQVVVPVKRLDVAKSRLAPHVGGLRGELALAMAIDTVTAAVGCPEVEDVVVVTDDAVAAAALRLVGARVVADEPGAGINAALRHGARSGTGPAHRGTAALSADLPALRSSELSAALRAAGRHSSAFVADTRGDGTTLYTALSVDDFRPAFGTDSAQAHARTATRLELDLPTLRRDVDTIDDLWMAIRLGVGTRTAALRALLPAKSA